MVKGGAHPEAGVAAAPNIDTEMEKNEYEDQNKR
jgi:hypothetical protein